MKNTLWSRLIRPEADLDFKSGSWNKVVTNKERIREQDPSVDTGIGLPSYLYIETGPWSLESIWLTDYVVNAAHYYVRYCLTDITGRIRLDVTGLLKISHAHLRSSIAVAYRSAPSRMRIRESSLDTRLIVWRDLVENIRLATFWWDKHVYHKNITCGTFYVAIHVLNRNIQAQTVPESRLLVAIFRCPA